MCKSGRCPECRAIKRGATQEKREHKWASKKTARRLASDHVRRKGTRAYPRR